ncbi:uncharacterized protein LOC126687687 [Mercurialis annua]|uniref:uncharacterized protein LOC126687687 n=1 Tax=Mercurialis annua TaxID=3986 RepID=UPI0024AD4CE1|nr:uncharacterized protein LOC126687687 [Mercurialis annua]
MGPGTRKRVVSLNSLQKAAKAKSQSLSMNANSSILEKETQSQATIMNQTSTRVTTQSLPVPVISTANPRSVDTQNISIDSAAEASIHAMNSITQNESMSTEATNIDDDFLSKKNNRGKGRGFEVKRRTKDGSKIGGVLIAKRHNLPVGPSEKMFKMEIGVLTRLMAPLGVFYWSDVTDANKEAMITKIQSEFEVDLSDLHVKEVVYKMMAEKHPPEDVKVDDWKKLCEHFHGHEQFKVQSAANVLNRRKLTVNHTSGSKSYCQRLYEIETTEDIDEQTPEMRLYSEAHRKKDGSWIHPQAEEKYKQMEVLRSQAFEEGAEIDGKKILEKVLDKPKFGYARGLGYGTKPTTSRELEFEARLLAEKSESEKRANGLNDQIQGQQATIDKLTQSQNKLMLLVQKLIDEQHCGKTSIDWYMEVNDLTKK